ncbi:exported hypothetical protein [Candidatus Sulfopaludibacter sp. SbA3]|nr:exported hypothetical protein [Candidatus Sulfopaludibacter sp. SbA3]
MRHRKSLVFLGFILLAAAVFLRSQPNMTMMVKRGLVLSANPTSIPAGQSVSVTFTAQVMGAVAQQVQLLRAGPDGTTVVVGTFQATGKTGYTLQMPVGLKTAGTLTFAARAIIPGVAIRASPDLASNKVLVSVVQAPPPPAVRILGAALNPKGIVQGQAANISVEASLSTRAPLQVILRRSDTNATLATLSPAQSNEAYTMMAAAYAIYTGTFSMVAQDAGVIPMQIVVAGPNISAVTADLALSVAPAPPAQTGTQAGAGNRSFSRFGLSFAIPAGWQVNQDIYDSGGPIALDNFASNFGQTSDGRLCCGGVLPVNGATIDVTVESTNGQDVPSFARNELRGAENTAFDQVRMPAIAATRARYDNTFTPSLRYSNQAVYLGQGSLVYKFYLSYRAGDARAADFTNAFQGLLNSVQFTTGQQ